MEELDLKYFDEFLYENFETCIGAPYVQWVDFLRKIRIAKFSWGKLIETDIFEADEDITTIECLATHDDETATLICRERSGSGHNSMKSYPRDSRYPVGCTVRLK
jgi:hypothetical protein